MEESGVPIPFFNAFFLSFASKLAPKSTFLGQGLIPIPLFCVDCPWLGLIVLIYPGLQ